MIGVLIGLGLKGIVFPFCIAGEDLPSGLTALGVPVMDSVASRLAMEEERPQLSKRTRGGKAVVRGPESPRPAMMRRDLSFPSDRAEGRQW